MFDFQTQAIFPTHAVASAGPLPDGAKRVQIRSADGEPLHGVHIPPAVPARSVTLVVGFAGNAWNSQDAATFLGQVFPSAHVVAFHYRGYRPSGGTPSAQALTADAPLVYDFAVDLVKPKRTVAAGFSIGSGVAAHLSGERPLDGLILVTPFDSLKAAAADLYPMLPISLLFEHEMDSASALRGSDVPVALIAAADDLLIGPARTESLRQSVGNLVFDRTIDRAGHNDLYDRGEFHQAMREALESIIKTR